jgi:hypothetical protein
VGDAVGTGCVDAVSAGEHFGAVAALAEAGVWRVGDREAQEGVGVGGCGLGIQVGGRKKERR